MPEIKVIIKWDTPDDKNWLNKYNVKLCLESYCKNTKFEVEEIAP